jgi:ABC-2 type transport system permease protein
MSVRRIVAVVGKDLFFGSKSLIFMFAIVVPLVLSLTISLLAGTLFSGKPRLGVADLDSSQLPARLAAQGYLTVRPYSSAETLRHDVERGALDMGIVLPSGFDAALQSGGPTDLSVYLWGESLLKNRFLLAASLGRQIVDLAGRDIPITTATILLGEGANVPWDVRLFPMVVIMTIIMGGTMVPATSLLEEKQQRTLQALTVTPTSLGEVLVAKGVTGVLISLVMGIVILLLNRAFGPQPGLLVLIVGLGAILAAAVGVILGTLIKDVNTLFTTMKSLGILLYAPALTYLFPQLPPWVARIFPTYYMIGPIVDMSLHGARWADVATDVYILCALIALAMAAAVVVARRSQKRRPAAA